MLLVDSHCHLDFPVFDADRQTLLEQARQQGVTRVVVAAVKAAGWPRLWELVEQHSMLYGTLGLHPCFLAEHDARHLGELQQWLERLRGHPRLCALGEIGLDCAQADSPRDAQQALLLAQLQLAKAFNLPVLLHVRRAHADCIALLKQLRLPRAGIVHAFSGSYEEAREYLRMGFKLGLGGAATWSAASRLQRVLGRLPLHGVVLETDAPDMAPAMFAGQRNSPTHLPAICTALATHLHCSPEQLAWHSSRNCAELFAWPDLALAP